MPDTLQRPSIETLGDAALLLRFGDSIDPVTNAAVIAFRDWLLARQWPGIVDLVPAYTSLAVFYDINVWKVTVLIERLHAVPLNLAVAAGENRDVVIPVCYDAEFAPDLAVVCAHSGLCAQDVVRIHCGGDYRVYFLGFVPGFAYLGGLDARLHTPRRDTPRLAVPAGSVAIGGAQTGVYPLQTPGGWQIIGRSPLRLFAPQRLPPSLLQAGDHLRFAPVTRDEYERLRACDGGQTP